MALADSNSHFVLLVLLRWRLFVNSLRRPGRHAEVGLQILWSILGIGFVLLISGAFFGGAYGLLQTDHPDLIDLLLLAVFLIWQLAPVLFEGYSPGLNFREVARYPISFRLYFLLNLAYGLSDPAAMACLIWLFSIWLAVLIVLPHLALTAVFAFLLFALFNLLCNRIVIGLFERFQSTRKGRERLVLVTLILLLLPQMLQFTTRAWTNTHVIKLPPSFLPTITRIRAVLPSGFTARIFLGEGAARLSAIGGLLLLGAIVFMLLARQMRAVFQGEIYSEGFTVRRELAVKQGWKFPIVDSVTSAIMEKELRYLRQNSRLILQLIYTPVLLLLIAFNGPGRRLPFATNRAGLLAGLAGFLLLSLPNLAYNTFGMDKEAFGRWLMSPPPMRRVLMAKNLTHGGIFAILYLLIATVLASMTHLALLDVATVTVGFFASTILQLTAGNVMSIHWPKRIELSQMSSKMTSGAAGITSLLVLFPLLGIWGLVALAARWWHLPWLTLAFGLAVLVGGLKIYSYVLDRSVAYIDAHIEEITGNLSA